MPLRFQLWKLPVLFVAFFLPLWGTHADDESSVRIDIIGGTANPVDFEVQNVSEGEVLGKATHQQASLAFPASKDWQKGAVTILPHNSGNIHIIFLGPWLPVSPGSRELVPEIVNFDDFTSDEVTIHNGSFEVVDEYGNPKYFIKGEIPESKPAVDESNQARVVEGDASEGRRYIRVWHNSRFATTVSVTVNVPVTFRFHYRLNP